jgi:hypothetical protein
MAAITIEEVLRDRFIRCDLVIAKVTHEHHEKGIKTAQVGRVYRTGNLFEDRNEALRTKEIDIMGGGGSWGETPTYVGEIGFLFLVAHLPNKRIYQSSWHGHIPIERHDDGLWCLLYQWKLWEQETVPEILRINSKPSYQRLADGKPFDTWVRFEAMESFLMGLIADIDQQPSEPIDVTDITPWLDSVKHA